MIAANMKYHKYLSIILILMQFFYCNYSLNIEELQLLHCKVDIQESPIKRGEEPSDSVIHVPSMNGQEYTCLLPQHEEEESEKIPLNESSIDIKELLKPMESGPCLTKETGWWTSEVCFGRDIKQYHVKDGQVASYVIMMGFYDPDYDGITDKDQDKFTNDRSNDTYQDQFENDGSNDTYQDKFINGTQRYYSQYYLNGTECGHFIHNPNGQLRSTEVRFYCEADVEDYISQVDEPETCKYIIHVHTPRLCSHPQLKPLPEKKVNPVPCHPLLDEEEYSSYMEKENGVSGMH